jgi:hypothetical protein
VDKYSKRGLRLIPLSLFRLGGLPHRAQKMDFSQDVVFFPAFFGRGETGFQFAQFVLAMIAAIEFLAAFDH